jgi:transcriptional regulator with XRE-family HTH domain
VNGALLTKALKRLRQDSGQQQQQVADALEWKVSKLIRIENGGASISRADLAALLGYYELADQEQVSDLSAWARDARARGWWDRFHIKDKVFECYVGYESGAASIRMVQTLLVPGILQTEDYARIMTTAFAAPTEVDAVVQLRLARQKETLIRKPDQSYILDEAVLRRPVGDAMPGQLRHLVELARRPEIAIQVIPFRTGPHFGLRGPFVLLGFDVPLDSMLFLESARCGDLIVTQENIYSGENVPGVDYAAETIARYEEAYEALARLALEPAESASLIKSIADAMS